MQMHTAALKATHEIDFLCGARLLGCLRDGGRGACRQSHCRRVHVRAGTCGRYRDRRGNAASRSYRTVVPRLELQASTNAAIRQPAVRLDGTSLLFFVVEPPQTKRTSKGHLVGKWARKRPNRRYGAGQGGGHDTLGPFISTAHSESPGRKNPLAASSMAETSPPAPHHRFGRFQTKKSDNMPPRNLEGGIGTTSRRKPRHAQNLRHADP